MNEPRSDLWRDVSVQGVTNGIVGFIFAATGPVALVLAALAKGGLGETELASWIFGGFVLNGIFTFAFSLAYRQPLIFLWSMPGTVLVGHALTHLTWPEVIGAYIATGLLMLVLGLTGVVNRSMSAVPMPVVLAMVAGVFLQFGIDWIKAFGVSFPIAAAMTAIYFGVSAWPALARNVPPILAALVAGVVTTWATGTPTSGPPLVFQLAAPKITMPAFSWPAMIELVVPLAITVIVVQNGQGIAVLSAAGHSPPVDRSAAACGFAASISGLLGTVPCCLAGAVMAVVVSSDERERQYVGALVLGGLAMLFGLVSPMLARLAFAAPKALIATLAGLAMLKVLQGAFVGAFRGAYPMSALVTFLITVSGVAIFNIGAPFWGIVFGYLTARLIERDA